MNFEYVVSYTLVQDYNLSLFFSCFNFHNCRKHTIKKKLPSKQDTSKQNLVSHFYMYGILQSNIGQNAGIPNVSAYCDSKYFTNMSKLNIQIMAYHVTHQNFSSFPLGKKFLPFFLFSQFFFLCLCAQSILLFPSWIMILFEIFSW